MKLRVAPTATPAIVMPSIKAKGSPSMSMRSANVPEAPSSALQVTYSCAAGQAFRTSFSCQLHGCGPPGRDHGNRGVRQSPPRRLCDRGHELRSEEHTSELQSLRHLVCRLLL